MYKVISGYDNLLNSNEFPEWADLSAFVITSPKEPRDVEIHYHGYEEIWFWWGGKGGGWIEGAEYTLMPGVLSYAPPHRLHAIKQQGFRKNTLIVPRVPEGQKWGHLHLEETGETLKPERNTILLNPEQTLPGSAYEFPEGSFLKKCTGGVYQDGDAVVDGTCPAWTAVLVREGTLAVKTEGDSFELNPEQCICISKGTEAEVRASGTADAAVVRGW